MTSAVAVQPEAIQITPAIRKKAMENMERARVQLAISNPFFASITLKRKIELSDTVPTAYVTMSGRIVFGTKFAAELTVQENIFVLAHEAMHYAMMHAFRRMGRDPEAWNIACDKVINALLKLNNVGQPPKQGAYQDGAEKFSAEQLYEENKDEGGGKGKGKGSGPYIPGQGLHDLSEEDVSSSDERKIEEEIKRELAQAVEAAKQVGALPHGVEELVHDIIHPRTPWYQLLRPLMQSLIKADITWAKPNKRYAHMGIYLPSADKKPKMGTVIIQVDESGSIGELEVRHFFGHCMAIVEQCNPEKIIILHTDTRVAKVEELTCEDFPFEYKVYAGGGTDMVAGIRWVQENDVECDAFICLTDGYTPWPTSEPGFPNFWLITSDEKSPVGVSIKYDMSEGV